MSLDQTNALLGCYSGETLLVFLTGASGAGKSHLAEALGKRLDGEKSHVAHFDRIGVPALEEMVRDYGSGEKWQEAKTHEWIQKLAAMKDKALIVFEGQYNPQFAVEGCERAGIINYMLVVVDCDEAVRERRLNENRKQSELINEDMRNWARLLRAKTEHLGGVVLDTSSSNLSENMSFLARLINKRLQQ